MKHLRRYTALLLVAVLLISMALSGCMASRKDRGEPYSQDIFAMDTYMTLTAYGEHKQEAVVAAAKEINRLDALLSTGNEDSEVSKINRDGGGSLSEDTNILMDWALQLYDATDHSFDATIYPVMRLWGFTDDNYRVPSDAELKKALELVDSSAIDYDARAKTVSFEKKGMAIDFGAIAKGYASAKVMDVYREHGVSSGIVNLGGNVQTLGLKPDGDEWKIGIQHPEDEDAMLGVVKTHDRAVITSGAYERNFKEDGVTYHHIIDPATGYPADSGLTSVTIVSRDGTLADGLATSFFIRGKEFAAETWREHKDDFDFVLCEKDGTLVVSNGLKENFTPSAEDATVEYVE